MRPGNVLLVVSAHADRAGLLFLETEDGDAGFGIAGAGGTGSRGDREWSPGAGGRTVETGGGQQPEQCGSATAALRVSDCQRLFGRGHPAVAADDRAGPRRSPPYIDLSYLLYEKKQYTDALKNLELGLNLDPTNIRALILKGELEELAGLNGTAIETYHRVLQVDPYNIVSRLKLASLEIKMGEHNRATPILRPICHNNSATIDQRAEAQWLLGIAYGADRRWSDSVASLEQSLKNRKDVTADDWYRVAYACLQDGQMEKVYPAVTQALTLNPMHTETNRLSHFLTQQNQPTQIQQASMYTPLQQPGFIRQAPQPIPIQTLTPPQGWEWAARGPEASDLLPLQ